jgi:DNA-directed RNA polymerase subunit E'/Rpb7
VNYSFQDLGKVLKINKIVNIGIGKIHVDTGFSKTPVTFEAEVCFPKIDQIIKGTIEKYDSNGGVYVNFDNILSIFCLNSNLNSLLNKIKSKDKDNKKREKINKEIKETENENNENNENSQDNKDNIGLEVSVKIIKINFNEQNIIVIGKII